MRLGLSAAAVLATAGTTAVLPTNLASFAHLLAFGFWFGSSIWVNIAGFVMFKWAPSIAGSACRAGACTPICQQLWLLWVAHLDCGPMRLVVFHERLVPTVNCCSVSSHTAKSRLPTASLLPAGTCLSRPLASCSPSCSRPTSGPRLLPLLCRWLCWPWLPQLRCLPTSGQLKVRQLASLTSMWLCQQACNTFTAAQCLARCSAAVKCDATISHEYCKANMCIHFFAPA